MTWTYYVLWLHSFNTLIQISRDLLLFIDILIFVKIIKEMILCGALWNASAEGIVNMGVHVLTFSHGNPGGNHTAYGATQYARSAAVKRKIKTIV